MEYNETSSSVQVDCVRRWVRSVLFRRKDMQMWRVYIPGYGLTGKDLKRRFRSTHTYSHTIFSTTSGYVMSTYNETRKTRGYSFYVSLLWNNRDSLVVLAFSGYWE